MPRNGTGVLAAEVDFFRVADDSAGHRKENVCQCEEMNFHFPKLPLSGVFSSRYAFNFFTA